MRSNWIASFFRPLESGGKRFFLFWSPFHSGGLWQLGYVSLLFGTLIRIDPFYISSLSLLPLPLVFLSQLYRSIRVSNDPCNPISSEWYLGFAPRSLAIFSAMRLFLPLKLPYSVLQRLIDNIKWVAVLKLRQGHLGQPLETEPVVLMLTSNWTGLSRYRGWYFHMP